MTFCGRCPKEGQDDSGLGADWDAHPFLLHLACSPCTSEYTYPLAHCPNPSQDSGAEFAGGARKGIKARYASEAKLEDSDQNSRLYY